MILIIKHIDIEGPGTLGDFLTERNIPFKIIDLGAGEAFPKDFKNIEAVVVLGGPMNVDEENKYPFLKKENFFIQEIVRREIPYLGICLGSQLLAKACAAKVVKSPVKEIGWYKIHLTKEGGADFLFQDFDSKVDIYQWHEDMFQVPERGKLLASGDGCPHQAFVVGKNAYGLQFHVEITDKSIKEWSEEYCQKDLPGRNELCQRMIDGYNRNRKDFNAQAYRIYENFLEIVQVNHAVRK